MNHIENKTLRDIVHGDPELAPLGRQPLVGQSVVPEQQADDDGEDRNEEQQNPFADAPVEVAISTEIAAAMSTTQTAARLTVPAFSAGFAEPPGM
jgi:hypothetical protein